MNRDDQQQGSNSVIFNTKWGIASVVIVAAVVAAAAGVTVTTIVRDHDSSKVSAAHDGGHSPTAGKTHALGDPGSVCGLTGYEVTEDDLFEIPETTWAPTGQAFTREGVPIRGEQMQLPSIQGQGPGMVTDAGVRTCFARTQAGAVLAAVNMMSVQATPSIAADVVAATTADGPGKDAAVARAKEPTAELVNRVFQVAGYQVSSYDGDTAVVTIAMDGGRGQLLGVPVSMRWEDGDWKTTLTADGQQQHDAFPMASLGGYRPWSAN